MCVGGFAAVVGVGRWCDRLLLLREGGYFDMSCGRGILERGQMATAAGDAAPMPFACVICPPSPPFISTERTCALFCFDGDRPFHPCNLHPPLPLPPPATRIPTPSHHPHITLAPPAACPDQGTHGCRQHAPIRVHRWRVHAPASGIPFPHLPHLVCGRLYCPWRLHGLAQSHTDGLESTFIIVIAHVIVNR